MPRKIVSIQGHNGSGKTTFIKTILGQMQPVSGEFSWSVDRDSVSYLPQLISYDAKFSYTLQEILSLYQVPEAYRAKLPEKLLAKKWLEASGGERQLVMLLTRITQSTRVLILDEPFNHLDLATIGFLTEFLSSLVTEAGSEARNSGPLSIILVSHFQPDIDPKLVVPIALEPAEFTP